MKYGAEFLVWLAREHGEYTRKVRAIEALGSVFMFMNDFGYECAKNVYPESLLVLVEAVKKLYDRFVEEMEGREESQAQPACSTCDSVLSEILKNPVVLGVLDFTRIP